MHFTLFSASAPSNCHPHPASSIRQPASSIHILHPYPPLPAGSSACTRWSLPSKFNERYGIKIISSIRPMAGKQDTHTHTYTEGTQRDKWDLSSIGRGSRGKTAQKTTTKLKTKEMSKTPDKSWTRVCTARSGPIPCPADSSVPSRAMSACLPVCLPVQIRHCLELR